jgi:hypothetical protein
MAAGHILGVLRLTLASFLARGFAQDWAGESGLLWQSVRAELFVEVFTTGESHSIEVRFQDKTTLHFVIDPYLHRNML